MVSSKFLPTFPPFEDGEILIIQAESELHQEQDQPWHGSKRVEPWKLTHWTLHPKKKLVFTLWWTNILPWKITIFYGKIHYFYGHVPLLC